MYIVCSTQIERNGTFIHTDTKGVMERFLFRLCSFLCTTCTEYALCYSMLFAWGLHWDHVGFTFVYVLFSVHLSIYYHNSNILEVWVQVMYSTRCRQRLLTTTQMTDLSTWKKRLLCDKLALWCHVQRCIFVIRHYIRWCVRIRHAQCFTILLFCRLIKKVCSYLSTKSG